MVPKEVLNQCPAGSLIRTVHTYYLYQPIDAITKPETVTTSSAITSKQAAPVKRLSSSDILKKYQYP